jgi:hypothetical protein
MNISKPSPNVSIRTTVAVNLSAGQWALKTDKFPRTIIEKVADILNKRLTLEYNRGENRIKVKQSMQGLARSFEIYGATHADSEHVLDSLLDELYRHTNAA